MGIASAMSSSGFDIQNLKVALNRYIDHGDFSEAEKIAKRILETSPADHETLAYYDKLQDWKYMDIRNGVLVKYSGESSVLDIPHSVREIGRLSQTLSWKVKKVIIPSSVNTIRHSAFENTKIEAISLPDSITFIESHAFAGTKIKEIKLPARLPSIENGTFSHCECLHSIIIPDSVTEIKDGAFWMCSNLKEAVLPQNLKSIGKHAFGGCTQLSIVVPKSVTHVDCEAFIYIRMSDTCADTVYRCKHVIDNSNSLTGRRRRAGLCLSCGGRFSIWDGTCKKCGISRDKNF
jgi:hypothetical protein